MQQVTFNVDVPGNPKGQGSIALARNPSTGQGFARYSQPTVLYRNTVIAILKEAWGDRAPILRPVSVDVDATFSRPLGHYGTGRNAGILKSNAPNWHDKTVDLDKILRLYGDALTIAGVIHDDRQIAVWRANKKWGRTGSVKLSIELLP